MSSEGLLRVNLEGRLEPWIAESWTRSPDGLHLTLRLRPGVKFHDGSKVDATAVAAVLNEHLTKSLKSFADDVVSIAAQGERDVEVTFRSPSSMFLDALMDVQIVKVGTAAGTGPFMAGTKEGVQVAAFDDYYLGRPTLGGLAIITYPNVRAAWAELLRNQVDMLYEVDSDAIETMKGATNVGVYAFDRPYQYVLFLNSRSSKLQAPEVRKALNKAIDRPALVHDALGGHAKPSVGPISSRHWAFAGGNATFTYAPAAAAARFAKPLTLRCVTVGEAPFEQLALVVKQQLKAVGIDLQVEAVPVEQVMSTLAKNDFDTVLLEQLAGWSLSRTSRWWHSGGVSNFMRFSDASVDAALDRVNHALDDDEYRRAVADVQRSIADNPPALFLAWSERSRAVSNRFDVEPEPGRDVLATLRLWHPRTDKVNATHH